MKIKPEHYQHMKEEIAKIDRNRAKCHYENLKHDNRVKDINMRFRFDLMYASGLNSYICNNIYPYANDNHIDTALKHIVKELNLPSKENEE